MTSTPTLLLLLKLAHHFVDNSQLHGVTINFCNAGILLCHHWWLRLVLHARLFLSTIDQICGCFHQRGEEVIVFADTIVSHTSLLVESRHYAYCEVYPWGKGAVIVVGSMGSPSLPLPLLPPSALLFCSLALSSALLLPP